MPYNFVTDSFHTKKLCSRLSSSKVNAYGVKAWCGWLGW